jgi:hypothetical protein
MNKIATVAAALVLPALWSPPIANADSQFNGFYYPVPGKSGGLMTAHVHSYGNGGDPSRPTSTITNADGCTIDTFESQPSLTQINSDGAHGFMSGHVTSGGGPNCQDTTRMSFDITINKFNGECDLSLFDIDNSHGWTVTHPGSC